MCGFFLKPANSPTLQMSNGCPTIQLNSNTNYWELAQTLQVRGSGPQICLHVRCWLQVLDHQGFRPTSCKSGGSHSPLLRINNLLKWLTEYRRVFSLLLWVYCKGYNSGTDKWKRYKVWEQGFTELPSSSGHVTLPAPCYIHQLRSSLNLIIHEFFVELDLQTCILF